MNLATLWGCTFVDELARAGVEHVVLCPGSRSTPLVMAIVRDGRFRPWVQLDERSGAFFALGIGKVTDAPAAVVTTSGTAVANLFPAVIEASYSETPLLLITADRPRRLRGTDANQTIDQAGLFGHHVRAAFDLEEPTAEEGPLRLLRARADEAVAAAMGLPPGPVHVNVPLDKPLEPGKGEHTLLVDPDSGVAGVTGSPPLDRPERSNRAVSAESLDEAVERLSSSTRGVIVAGPSRAAARTGPAVVALAAETGFPLLADPLSGARYGPSKGALVLGSYDLILRARAAREALAPDLIVQVGRMPTSAATGLWLESHEDVSRVVIDPGTAWRQRGPAGVGDDDAGGESTRSLAIDGDPEMDAVAFQQAMAGRIERSTSERWRRSWRSLEDAVVKGVGDFHEETFFEGTVLADVADATGSEAPLFVSSSMPVRDLDMFGAPREAPMSVYGNRGASGIDGIVSTALGVSVGAGVRAVAVLGDIAFLHDLNGLMAAREEGASAVFVVIHNDGGGIFHMLPIREYEPDFTPYFATPHGLDFAHAAALHNLPYRVVGTRASLRSALLDAFASEGSQIIEVQSERAENQQHHEAVYEAAASAVGKILAEEETS